MQTKVSMSVQVSIAANTTNENVIQGQQYQFAPFSGFLRLLETGSAIGLRRTLSVAGRSIGDREFVSTANRVPLDPDDTAISDVWVNAGDPIIIPVQNTTPGALTYFAKIWLEAAEYAE